MDLRKSNKYGKMYHRMIKNKEISMKPSLLRARPHLWYQLYWVLYLIWFFWLDFTVTDPKYIIRSPLDDFIDRKSVV